MAVQITAQEQEQELHEYKTSDDRIFQRNRAEVLKRAKLEGPPVNHAAIQRSRKQLAAAIGRLNARLPAAAVHNVPRRAAQKVLRNNVDVLLLEAHQTASHAAGFVLQSRSASPDTRFANDDNRLDDEGVEGYIKAAPPRTVGPSFWQIRNNQTTGLLHEQLRKRALRRVADNTSWMSDGLGFVGKQVGAGLVAGSLTLWLPKPNDKTVDGASWVWNQVVGNAELIKRLRLTSLPVAMQVVSAAGTVYEAGRGRISKREFARQMGRATTGVFVLLLPVWIAPALGTSFGMTVLLHCTISLSATGLNAAVDYAANRYILYAPTETEVLLARFEAEAKAEHAKRIEMRRVLERLEATTQLRQQPQDTYQARLRWAIRAVDQKVPWPTVKRALEPFKGLFLSMLCGYALQQALAYYTGMDFGGEDVVAAEADPRRSWLFQKLIEPGTTRRLVEVPFDAAMATIVVPALITGSARAVELSSAAFMKQLRARAHRRGWKWVPLNKSVSRAVFHRLISADDRRFAQIAGISATVYEHYLRALGTEAGRKVNYDTLLTIADRETVPHLFAQLGRIDAAIDRAEGLGWLQRLSLKWQLMTPEHLLVSLTTHTAMQPGDTVYTSLKPGAGDAFKYDGRAFVNVRTGEALSAVAFAARKHQLLSVDIAHRASDIDGKAAELIAEAMAGTADVDPLFDGPEVDVATLPVFDGGLLLNRATGKITADAPPVGPLGEHLERLQHHPQLGQPTRVRAHWPTGVTELFPDFAAAAELAQIAKTNPDMAEALGSITQRMASAQVLGEKAEDRRIHDRVALDREHAVRMGGPANMGQLMDSGAADPDVLDAWALRTKPDPGVAAVANQFGTRFGELGHRYQQLLGGHQATADRAMRLANDVRQAQAQGAMAGGTETAAVRAQQALARDAEFRDLQDADVSLQQGLQRFYGELRDAEAAAIEQRFDEHLGAGEAERERALEQLQQLAGAVTTAEPGPGYLGGAPGAVQVDVAAVRSVTARSEAATAALQARTNAVRVPGTAHKAWGDFRSTARFARQAEWAKAQVERIPLVDQQRELTAQAAKDFAVHTDALLGMAAAFDMDMDFLTEMAAAMAADADVGLSDLHKLGQMLKELQQKQAQQVGAGYESLHTALQECDAVYAGADIDGTELKLNGAPVSDKLKRQCFSTPLAVGAVGWLAGGGLATLLQSTVLMATGMAFAVWGHYILGSTVGTTLVARTVANIVTRTMEINAANPVDAFEPIECAGMVPCPPGCERTSTGCAPYPDHVLILSRLVETVMTAAIQLDGTGLLSSMLGPIAASRGQTDVLFAYTEVGAALYKGAGTAGAEALGELFRDQAAELDPAVRQARADAAGDDGAAAGDAKYLDRLWLVLRLATTKGPAGEAASTMLFGNRYSAARRLWNQYLDVAGDDALDGIRRLGWALTADAAMR